MKALNNILLLLAYSLCISAQTTIKPYNIVLIDKQYQVCLDDGQNMKCALSYYNKMDRCLNVAYKQLLSTIEGRDGEMAIEDEKAKFIKERVLVLINKIETIR